LVVREWRAVLGGQEVVLPHLSLFKMSAEKVSLELSPPPGTLALLAGDFVEALVESVVLPMNAGDYYGSDAKLEQSLQTLDTRAAGVLAAEMSADSATATASWYSSRLYSHWQLAALEAVGNSPVVHVTVGELESAHPLRVRVDAATQAAAFTVSGGVGFVPITLTGVRTAGEFELLHRSTAENSTADPAERYFEWAKLDQSTDAANDFWQTDFDVETQQFSITVNVPMASSFEVTHAGALLNLGVTAVATNYSFSNLAADPSPTPAPITPMPTPMPTPFALKAAPTEFVNAATVAPTAGPTDVPLTERFTLIRRAGCLLQCQTTAPAAASKCQYFDYVLNQCPGFGSCSEAEARVAKDRCLALGSCTSLQCGVPNAVVLVDVPAAEVAAVMPIAGVNAAQLAAEFNMQLALRSGLAASIGVVTDDVTITSMSAALPGQASRRLAGDALSNDTASKFPTESHGTIVEFAIATTDVSVESAADMEVRIEMQAPTFDAFVQASAASLGVLGLFEGMRIDSDSVTMEQGTVKSLPDEFVATTPLLLQHTITTPEFVSSYLTWCPRQYYLGIPNGGGLIGHGSYSTTTHATCLKCPPGQTSGGGLSTMCHSYHAEWVPCTHVFCRVSSLEHCSFHSAANQDHYLTDASRGNVSTTGCTGRQAGNQRVAVYHHGSEGAGSVHRCSATEGSEGNRKCVCSCKDVVEHSPTAHPTTYPTAAPTKAPTAYPTAYPSASPTASPTPPTPQPTAYPTAFPTSAPTANPTAAPTSCSGLVNWEFGDSLSRYQVKSLSAGTLYKKNGGGLPGAFSSQKIQQIGGLLPPQGVQFKVEKPIVLVGLSNGDTDFTVPRGHGINFGMYVTSTNGCKLYVKESGVGVASYLSNGYTSHSPYSGPCALEDLFEVRVTGTTVSYVQNGVTVYTSKIVPTFPLVVDATMQSTGSTLYDVHVTRAKCDQD
jgi:hypothetical protein